MQSQIDEGVQKALASILSGDGGHILSEIQKKLNNGNSQTEVKESLVEEKVEKVIPTVVTPPTFEKTEENDFVKEEVKVENKKEEVISETVENKPKKPSSFSKLMGSLN